MQRLPIPTSVSHAQNGDGGQAQIVEKEKKHYQGNDHIGVSQSIFGINSVQEVQLLVQSDIMLSMQIAKLRKIQRPLR